VKATAMMMMMITVVMFLRPPSNRCALDVPWTCEEIYYYYNLISIMLITGHLTILVGYTCLLFSGL